MTIGNCNTNLPYSNSQPTFKADKMPTPLAKPIEVVQHSIEGVTDTVLNKPKDKRKSNARTAAIAAGSSVLVLTGILAVLNPKYASSFAEKLKSIQIKRGNSGFISKLSEKASQLGYLVADYRSSKDYGVKWLCTEEKAFSKVKNDSVKNIFQTCDKGFRAVFKKPHEVITKWFDQISRKTVQKSYASALKKMNSFENLVKIHNEKLSEDEIKLIESKLKSAEILKEKFSAEATLERLNEQEKLMSHLEPEFKEKWDAFCSGLKKGAPNKKEHIEKNLRFWAEDILQPTRDNIEKEGLQRLENLIGNGKDKAGVYNEIIDILSPHISAQEKRMLEKSLEKTSKKLKKANFTECAKYFDKKRDLILGGAPTDILTAILGLSMSGVVIASADNKEDRLSRCLTGVFPVIAGLGANLVFTAQLISGILSMVYSGIASFALSKIGSITNHYIFNNNVTKEDKSA